MPPWRIAAAAATVVALAWGLAFPAMSAAAISESNAVASGCRHPVWFLGARGSGESANGYDGMGPPIDHMASVIASDLAAKGLRMARLANPYNADSVSDLKPNATVLALLAAGNLAAAAAEYIHTSVDRYDASTQQGIQEAEYDVGVVLADCPSAKIIMAGYSQGAVAVHDAENYLAKNKPAEFSHIAGTLLLGDPDRVPYTKAKLFGTSAARAEGLRVYLKLVRKHDVPDPATTANIANANDIVGDFALKHLLHASAAIAVHKDYAHLVNGVMKYEPVLDAAAHWVATKIPGLGPNAPTNFVAMPDSGGSYTVSWTAASTNYGQSLTKNVVRFYSPSHQLIKSKTVGGNVTSAVFTGLPTAEYTATVQAYDVFGGGPTAKVYIAGQWAGAALPLPSNATSGQGQLQAVSCPSASECIGVGNYTDTSGKADPLLLTWSGGTWTPAEAPLPPNAASNPENGGAHLGAVSCPSVSVCVAVGSYTDSSKNHNLDGLLLTWSGGTWTQAEAPLPAGAVDGATNVPDVSCPSVSTCIAVGNHADKNTPEYGDGLLLTWSGGTWTAAKAPVPADAAISGTYAGAGVSHVSCPSVSVCVATGWYFSTAGGEPAQLLTWSGGTWTATKAPVPPNAAVDSNQVNSGVSCPSASECITGGDYWTPHNTVDGLLLNWSGGTWNAAEAPIPPNGIDLETDVRSVSCPYVSECVAVGEYEEPTGFGAMDGLLLTWSGGTWTAAEAPLPANAGTNTGFSLDGVSCPSTSDCVAVGSYVDSSEPGSGDSTGLLVTWSGGKWTAAKAPFPSNANSYPNANVNAVSCPSVSVCIASGTYLSPTNSAMGVLLTGLG